ncbi:MAG: MBL fold metallo-hydrolase [Spirochaetales bacterium]|nr:MBL fold metallo-hydrolase [Spirochaetales bacterium]
MGRTDAWFTIVALDDRTWLINDHGRSLIYLAAGNERALLIDTGWGVGDLSSLVASLTPLPLVVANTHGHPDHFSGNGAFQRVHLNAADRFMAAPLDSEDRRLVRDMFLSRRLPQGMSLENWNPEPRTEFLDLNDGDTFDLGGRTVEAIAVPGHSPGSVVLFDREGGRLFTGDSVAQDIWLQLEESTPLSMFAAGLRRLQGLSFDAIFPGHGRETTVPLPQALLNELMNGVERILAGTLSGRPVRNFAGTGRCCDFSSCSVIYRPDRL